MKDDLIDLLMVIFTFIGLISIIFLVGSEIFSVLNLQSNQPKPLQNVVCDTSYGVQYFEHKGVLTLRVNHEGNPIRCYE